MHEPFNANRLRLGRALRGLFIQEVAARAGVSSRSVSAWENGTTTPGDAHACTLADVLRLPREFFGGREPPVLPSVLFRSQGRLKARQRDMALAAGVQAVMLEEWISGQSERPFPALPDLRTMTPAHAAEELRKAWRLGNEPVPPIVPLLEEYGIRLYSFGNSVADVEAYSLCFGGLPFILVNTSIPPLRRRVCIAHELGHQVLRASVSDSDSRARETEADVFAAEFLMPATPFLKHAPRVLAMDTLEEARQLWRVPKVVYLRRLRDLGRLPEWRYRALCTEARVRGETGDTDDALEEATSPFLTRFLASSLDGVWAREAAARHLRVHLPDLDAIAFASVTPTRT